MPASVTAFCIAAVAAPAAQRAKSPRYAQTRGSFGSGFTGGAGGHEPLTLTMARDTHTDRADQGRTKNARPPIPLGFGHSTTHVNAA